MNIRDKVLHITIIGWFFIAYIYLNHVSIDHCSNDFWQHIEYTEIITTQHRFPAPYDGFQTYHPPFYHLLNSIIIPKSIIENKQSHAHFGQLLSIIYGALMLAIIYLGIKEINKNPKEQILILLYIASTPMFTFMYTTYNNDSLANLLSMGIIVLSYRLYLSWSKNLALLLMILAIIALYTKYTVAASIIAVVAVCLKNLLKLKYPNLNQKKIILILCSSFLFLIPWLIFHNYYYTGKLFPSNFERQHSKYEWSTIKSFVRIVLPTAIFKDFSKKWQTVSNHPFGGVATKKYDYWTYIFLNTVTQGAVFKTPGYTFILFLLILHLIVYFAGMREIFKTNITKLAAFVILAAHTFQIIALIYYHARQPFSAFYGDNPFITYRYFCWDLIGWGILYGSAVSKENINLSKIIILAIICNCYFLKTVSGCSP